MIFLHIHLFYIWSNCKKTLPIVHCVPLLHSPTTNFRRLKYHHHSGSQPKTPYLVSSKKIPDLLLQMNMCHIESPHKDQPQKSLHSSDFMNAVHDFPHITIIHSPSKFHQCLLIHGLVLTIDGANTEGMKVSGSMKTVIIGRRQIEYHRI